VVPVTDAETYTVVTWPPITDNLGIWRPWTNGGINPATGLAWAVGDKFVGAFVSNGTRDATSPDNADYDAFVQAAADVVGWGGKSWHAIVACWNDTENPDYNAARNANVPTMTTSYAIVLPNGAMLADNGADLANGPDIFFNVTETGSVYNGNVGTGAGRLCGDPNQTKIEHGASNRTDGAAWWRIYNGNQTSQWHFFALSEELTLSAVGSGSPFQTWASGGETFEGDANGDGVQDGIAFLLGATGPGVNALGLLPTATEQNNGDLVLSFDMLNAASRGTAALKLQWSNDLGVADPWGSNEALVPDESSTVNGVNFVVTPGSPTHAVEATIPASEAAGGGKLFNRLSGSEN
jgi:hypothetical protein